MYRGRYFNRVAAYVCGDYIDVDVYPVFQAPGRRRSRCKPTSVIQERLNRRNSQKRLRRTVLLNFGERDYALHLTYRTQPESVDEALRDRKNFIRRLKRLYAAQGIELKYIISTEQGGQNGRWHHHLFITGGVDRDAIERCWGRGYANTKRLQVEEDGLEALAAYIGKETRRKNSRPTFRRWSGSKNLVKPEPVILDGAVNMEEMRTLAEAVEDRSIGTLVEASAPGYELTGEPWAEKNGINHGWYIRFELKKKRRARRNE